MDEYIFKHRIQQGKAIRETINQPMTSAIRRDDISFCSSRILAAIPLVQENDPTLAVVIEGILEDLAAIQPDDAIRKVKDHSVTYPESAIFFATACHVVAQTNAEFMSETSPQTVSEIRESLTNWFQRFKDVLSRREPPYNDLEVCCLQIFISQASIFHEKDAYNWAIDKTFLAMEPSRFSSRFVVDLVCLAGGSMDWNKDEGRYIQFLEKMEEARDTFTYTDLVIRLIGGPKLDELSRPKSKKKSKKKKAKDENKKFFLVQWIEDALETVGWALPVIGLVLVGWLCLWGFGKFYSYFEDTSYVGQQSLSEWYENSEKMREQQKAEIEAKENAPSNETLTENIDPSISDVIEEDSENTEEQTSELADDENQSADENIEDLNSDSEPVEVAEAPTPSPTPEEISPAAEPTQQPNTSTPSIPPTSSAAESSYSPDIEQFYQQGLPPALVAIINEHRNWMIPRFKNARRNLAGHQMYAQHRGMPIVSAVQENMPVIVRYPITWHSGQVSDPTQWIEAHYVKDSLGRWSVTKAARCQPMNNTNNAAQSNMIYFQEPTEIAWAEQLFTPNPFY